MTKTDAPYIFLDMTTRTAYGLKSEQTPDGIVWHLMEGWRDDRSSFATWTNALATFTDYRAARSALREIEGRELPTTV